MEIIIEIFNRKTGEISETKTIPSDRHFKSFLFYWDMQCNKKDFNWRIKDEEKKV